jgi:hypothetical protein
VLQLNVFFLLDSSVYQQKTTKMSTKATKLTFANTVKDTVTTTKAHTRKPIDTDNGAWVPGCENGVNAGRRSERRHALELQRDYIFPAAGNTRRGVLLTMIKNGARAVKSQKVIDEIYKHGGSACYIVSGGLDMDTCRKVTIDEIINNSGIMSMYQVIIMGALI